MSHFDSTLQKAMISDSKNPEPLQPCVLKKRLTGIIGSGQIMIGLDPFDRAAWSGISYQVFSRLRDHGCLHRALGVEVSGLRRLVLLLRNAHPNRALWRQHYYMSRAYRDSLTATIGTRLRPDDFETDFLVLGAMYDVPRLVAGRSQCFSYHDGNLAQRLKSPYGLKGLSPRRIEEGLSFERNVYHNTTRILVMSEYLRKSFVEDYGVSPARIGVVGAGVNLDELPEVNFDKRYDTKQILFIGVNFARKGGPMLLKAFRATRSAHPDAKLHIVGPPNLQLPPEMAEGVVYHGFLNKDLPQDAKILKELFRTCSLFVMPSLYEPFGIAPLEAMVHQIPAIVTRAWALEEIVTSGVTGEHVERGSVDDLTERLRTLLGNPDLLNRMGNAARASVLARYTWPQVVSRIIAEIRAAQDQPSP